MTDQILQTATELTKHTKPRYRPIAGRVAYVVSHGQSFASNGYAIRTHGIAKALNGHGLETLCFVRPGRPWDMGIAKNTVKPEMVIDGVRYIHSRWPRDKKPSGEEQKFTATVSRLVELFTVYRPEVVIAASNHEIALPALVAARQLGLPFQYEVRGFWEVSRASRDPGWENTAEYKEHYDRESYIISRADQLYTLNTQMKAELVARGAKPERIDLVPNSVSGMPRVVKHSTVRQQYGIPENAYVLGYMGAITEYEGLDHLLEALALLKKENVYALIVGGYSPVNRLGRAKPEPIVQKLQKLAKSHGIHKQVIFTGRVDHNKLPEYFAAVNATVIPRAPLPVCELVSALKPLEYLSYGKPLIASNVAPQAEVLEQGRLGWLYEKGSAQSLADTVRAVQALADGAIEEKVQAGVDTVKSTYQWHKTTSQISQKVDNNKKAETHSPDNGIDTRKYCSDVPIEQKTLTLSGVDKENVARLLVPKPGAMLELSATVVYRLNSSHKSRKAVLLFDFFDSFGVKRIGIPGIGVSEAFKQHFRYLNASSETLNSDAQEVVKLKLPNNIASVFVSVAGLGLKPGEHIEIRIKGRCFDEEVEKERKRQLFQRQPLPKPIVHGPKNERLTSDLTVACVLDEFTAECLSHEVNLIKVTQEEWQVQLEQHSPDFLLVESCWKGNDGNWGTITKGSGGGKKLSGLLRHCKQNGIPTVFWNKEDPPHYDKFGPIAKLFDLAITTDVNMVARYKEDFGIDVYPLSFAAQPKIHNPEPVIPRLNKAVFAGSYYGDKPKRCSDFNDVMSQVEQAGVAYDIFDRNYQKHIEKFAFPDHYQTNIVGNLQPEEVWKAHKGYKYQINMNSVQDSATMFARRVYESLASGTPVLSNDSVGVRELFGDVVIMPNEQKSISEQLRELERSPEAYGSLARAGVRAVMREHTYGHRIQTICRLLGVDVKVALPRAILAVTASSEEDVARSQRIFAEQTAPNKHLFVELENFESAYKFLNESNDKTTFAMKLARDFYSDEHQYFGSSKVLKCGANDGLPEEALEDFLYWGEA